MNVYAKDSQISTHLSTCWQLEKPKKAKSFLLGDDQKKIAYPGTPWQKQFYIYIPADGIYNYQVSKDWSGTPIYK